MSGSVIEAMRCPRYGAPLDLRAPAIVCTACGQALPRFGHIPVLLADPDLRREVGPRSYSFTPATTTSFFESHLITACTDKADSKTTDREGVSRREESLRPTSGHGRRRRA